MSSTPSFIVAVNTIGIGQVTAANTNRDGTGTIVVVYTAGPSGSRLTDIEIQAIVTTTAGMVRLYLHDGTNMRLWKEIEVAAITPDAATPAFRAAFQPPNGLHLPAGWSLRASTEKAEAMNVIARGGNY